MRCLITGATGMLGQALVREAHARGMAVLGLGRRDADISVDIADDRALEEAVRSAAPDLIINTAALTDLAACESDVGYAYRVNARAVALMASLCKASDIRFCHISTDHFFTGDGARLHDEQAPVTLVNEYARTKYAAEAFAQTAPGALVLRTNITGFRGDRERPTFAEWVIQQLTGKQTIHAFTDYYCSTIDVTSFSRAAHDLLEVGADGILNLAAREVGNKKTFIEALAEELDLSGSDIRPASVSGLTPQRAESNGLDVSRAETLLGRDLPGLKDVAKALIEEYGQRA